MILLILSIVFNGAETSLDASVNFSPTGIIDKFFFTEPVCIH